MARLSRLAPPTLTQLPFAKDNTFLIIKAVGAGERPPLPPDAAALPGGTFPGLELYLSLMAACWAQRPADRPSFAEVCAAIK